MYFIAIRKFGLLFYSIFLLNLMLYSCSKVNNSIAEEIVIAKKTPYTQGDSITTQMKFMNRIVDFGELSQDTVVYACYNFVNVGDQILIINDVRPDCTCTGYTISNKHVSPGDSATIKLEFNTANKYGNVKIYSVVNANTSAKLYNLILKANILSSKNI